MLLVGLALVFLNPPGPSMPPPPTMQVAFVELAPLSATATAARAADPPAPSPVKASVSRSAKPTPTPASAPHIAARVVAKAFEPTLAAGPSSGLDISDLAERLGRRLRTNRPAPATWRAGCRAPFAAIRWCGPPYWPRPARRSWSGTETGFRAAARTARASPPFAKRSCGRVAFAPQACRTQIGARHHPAVDERRARIGQAGCRIKGLAMVRPAGTAIVSTV